MICDADAKTVDQDYVYVRLNKIETEDEFLQLGQYTFEGSYYDVGKAIKRPIHKLKKN